MASISLTDEQHEKMLKDFFAKKSARHRLRKNELIAIAQRLNEKINLPFLSEKKEHIVLVKLILKVDSYLYEILPNEIYGLIHDLDEGFDESEAAQLAARLSKMAHQEIELPFLSDHQEYYSVTFVLSVLINAMREGSDLEHAIKVTQHPRMMEDDFPFPEIL
ncbi:MAG: hypothetical protein ACRBB6_08325 [Neptuniibacter sp.]